ncbi:MAG: DUF190 domain-containing protein [Chlamydiales bacterium]|nr:DUF190 domain-containing protein [Chlamydiales bacterium]
MSLKKIKLVRIYMKESEHHVKEVMKILDEEKVQHAVVLRAIEGGHHSAHILSLSLDLPLVLEFFDFPEKVEQSLNKIKAILDGGHIIVMNGETF